MMSGVPFRVHYHDGPYLQALEGTEAGTMKTDSRIYRFIQNAGLALCKRAPALRKLRYVYWGRQRHRYQKLSAHAKTNPRMVVFEAYGGRQYACSPKALYETLCADARFDGWDLVWSFTEPVAHRLEEEGRGVVGLNARARIVVRGSEDYYDAFARAKYWIQNNRVPEYVSPRADQVYVQCWHGTPLKRLGSDVPETTSGGALNSARELADRFSLDARKWTWLLSPSEFTSRHLCGAFGVPEERRAGVVLEEGYPRNDVLRATLDAGDAPARIAAIKERLGLPADKKLLLFAPTWRDDQYTEGVGYTMDALIDLDELQAALGRDWAVLLRMHYYIANKLDLSAQAGFVYDVSGVGDINELYLAADALCTDYSSVFFDYANTGRPLLFYWPDFDHYANDLHGFYLDPQTLPGPKCATVGELARAVDGLDGWFDTYGAAYEEFRATYCPKDDGHAAERVIERVFFGVECATDGSEE